MPLYINGLDLLNKIGQLPCLRRLEIGGKQSVFSLNPFSVTFMLARFSNGHAAIGGCLISFLREVKRSTEEFLTNCRCASGIKLDAKRRE